MADYQDHYYPSEMSIRIIAQIRTDCLWKDVDAFLTKFDTDWKEI